MSNKDKGAGWAWQDKWVGPGGRQGAGVGSSSSKQASNTCENQIPWHHLRKLQNEHTQRWPTGRMGANQGVKGCQAHA